MKIQVLFSNWNNRDLRRRKMPKLQENIFVKEQELKERREFRNETSDLMTQTA